MMWKVASYIANDDRKTGFTYHKAAFKLLGLFYWGEKNWFQVFYEWYPIVNLGIGATLLTIDVIQKGQSASSKAFIELVKGSVLVFTLYFAMVKLVLFQLYSKEIRQAIDFLESLPKIGGTDTSANTRKTLVRYSVLLLTTGCGWAFFNSIHTGSPYVCYWPFETPRPKIFFLLLAFVQKLMVIGYCVSAHSAVDTSFPMLVTYMAYQGTRLVSLLETLGKNKYEYKKFKEGVNIHINILKSMGYVQSAFRVLFMCQVTYTIVHACVIAFSALKMDKIAVAVCDNTWYESDLKIKKSMVLMLQMANKSVTMNKLGVYTASLKTYLNSVQESFSCFLALKTVSSKL
ncbi:uncharacterized protein LOC106674045 isoform X2 [Cimex lectularius]|uniref:Odorant receptor n=1 Tax=Cimex lectularius TaxID=79782 RepID=A0A8I6SCQ6_CIMLE|nr:uncharacterized protein LOC106674045 isoform X2 [Cimex lectularius]